MSIFDGYFDDGHNIFRQTCRKFTQDHVAPFAEQWEEAHEFDVALYKKAAEVGILGLRVSRRCRRQRW